MLSANALERRLKRRIRRAEHEYAAICAPGFEHELLGELKNLLGLPEYRIISGGIEFSGSSILAYKANLHLRTAHRVLLRIKQFKALTFPMLYDQLSRVEWELWVPRARSFRVRVATRGSKLNMKARLIDTCREAIEARLASQGLSGEYDERSEYEFLLRINDNNATLSFNTSGLHLHKRGYKQSTVDAPIRETIAAGFLHRLHYRKFDVIVDPFCGSGTLLLEASQMALNIAPGAARKFAFMDAPFFEKGKWASLVRGAQNEAAAASSINTTYICSDNSIDAVTAATSNAKRAGVEALLKIFHLDYQNIDYRSLSSGKRLLLTNPPYGKRLKAASSSRKHLFDSLVSELTGWTLAYVKPKASPPYLSDKYLQKAEVVSFSNGGIPSELHIIQL